MIITNIITAFFLIILGFLIKKYNLSFLIAGYNTSSKKEKEKIDEIKLTSYIGNLLINSSFLLLVGTLILFLLPKFEIFIFNLTWILVVLFILISIIDLNTSKKVLKKN